jgi:hypothetical protein
VSCQQHIWYDSRSAAEIFVAHRKTRKARCSAPQDYITGALHLHTYRRNHFYKYYRRAAAIIPSK